MSHGVKRPLWGAVLALSIGSLSGCGGPSGPLQVQLSYAPTSELELGAISGDLIEHPVTIGQISDTRTREPHQIGENAEDAEKIKVLTSPESVTDVVRAGLTKGLQQAGFQMSDQGPRELKVEVLELWVQEENTYKGTVRLKIEVIADGQSQGNLVVDGTATRWGRSLSAENYREVISDCILHLVQNLLQSQDFREKMTSASGNRPNAD